MSNEENLAGNTDKDEKAKLLLTAAETNDVATLIELLDGDQGLINCQDSDGYSPLHRASYNNNVEALKVLLSRGADMDIKTVDGWQPLHSAVYWNAIDTASLLSMAGADINAGTNGGQTPLHLAASRADSREMLLMLLTHTCIDHSIVNSANETAYNIAYRTSKNANLFEMCEPSINEI